MSVSPLMIRPGEPGVRRAQLIDPRPGIVRAWVEDNFHHFEIAITHDGTRVTGLTTKAHRWPWSTCPAAGHYLAERMTGQRLDALAQVDSPFSHCTHMHDLAMLASAHAHDGRPLLYSCFVSDRSDPQHAELWRNDTLVFAWDVTDSVVSSGDEIDGRSLRQLRHWENELADDRREMARVLRRSIFIAGGRKFDYSRTPTADRIKGSAGACFTFQPENATGSVLTMEMLELLDGEGPLAGTIREVATA